MVRPIKTGRFMIVHGERRFRAAGIAGIKKIKAIVRPMTEKEAYRLSAIENIQRNDLTAIEEARVFQRFRDYGITQAEIGAIFGKTQGAISHALTLLSLPEGLLYYTETAALTE